MTFPSSLLIGLCENTFLNTFLPAAVCDTRKTIGGIADIRSETLGITVALSLPNETWKPAGATASSTAGWPAATHGRVPRAVIHTANQAPGTI